MHHHLVSECAKGLTDYQADAKPHLTRKKISDAPSQSLLKKVGYAITKTIMFQVVDGKYVVSVDWEPPLQADLPINKYKIFWSRRMQGETTIFNNLKEHKKTVQVSVYAICKELLHLTRENSSW